MFDAEEVAIIHTKILANLVIKYESKKTLSSLLYFFLSIEPIIKIWQLEF
jgi:hypothetical protein